jgi:octanoyl-[GcvH]:protein N-octanoyltransferase
MARFEDAAAMVVEALRAVSVDARVGQLPDEYCPGAYSVIATCPPAAGAAARAVKLGGAAQRNLRRAWHLSLSLVVADPDPIRRVLTDVHRDLGYPLDPSTVGAAGDAAPGVTVDDVDRALLAAWAERFSLVESIADEALLAEAAALAAGHRPDGAA